MRLIPADREIGWTPFLYLVYLGIPIMNLTLGPADFLDWAVTLGLIAVFLPLYFSCYWVTGWRAVGIAGAITALGCGGVLVNPGANVFWVYAAAALAATGTPLVNVRWLLGLLALIGLEAWLFHLHPWTWGPGIVFSTMIGALCIHYQEVRRSNAELRLAHEEVERLAKLAEKERIARDLHDLLGHTLSVVVVKSELASKIAERDPERAVQEIREVEQIARQALTEVRRAVEGYRVEAGEGLEQELAKARRALDSARVVLQVEMEEPAVGPRLGHRQEAVLALAVREAVTNVVRHARATRCRIALFFEAASTRLEISDNGCGGADIEGSGLAGMRERVEALGGRVSRSDDQGTRLEITLPLLAKVTP